MEEHPRKLATAILVFFLLNLHSSFSSTANQEPAEKEPVVNSKEQRRVIKVEGGPESVIWAVQLSDLHFSVHHPDRAIDFRNLVGPALSMINPYLVFITGDLTDGKSKDLLTMKQNEDEWVEYKDVMEAVVESSGLNRTIFYDLRGNHDNFGVPTIGGSVDFFSKYSINGQLGRTRNINSVTVETGDRKHLFVGVDTTMRRGLRGPTNLFGHPTDVLLGELDSQLSQWDSQSTKPVTKISFGHFPLSFSASSTSQRSLKDVFLKHSLAAYVCGHLHARFGKNLKRHHQSGQNSFSSNKLFQLNLRTIDSENSENCSFGASPVEEFWEWEMGDWRKSRAMRILAIDRGHVSYVDLDLKSDVHKTIILPTFPLDSRFMSSSSARHKYECQHMVSSSYDMVRALIFSQSPIVAVVARIYDTSPGFYNLVMESPMRKHGNSSSSRGDFYAAPWNYKAFEDPSPDRFWLQLEATDIRGRTTFTELRPFSINGLGSKISWTWKEFFVMGCQWSSLYYPLLWTAIYSLFLVLLIPKLLDVFKKHYTYKKFMAATSFINFTTWVLQELCRLPIAWSGYLAYIIYLVSVPWLIGQVFTDKGSLAYMTYMGWVVTSVDRDGKHEYIGNPDVMVVVLTHLVFVLIPGVLVSTALAAEREVFRHYVLSISGKKEDDRVRKRKKSGNLQLVFEGRWIRKILLLVCLAISWKHFKKCRALVKAYEMNPLLHFPVYCFTVPTLLFYIIYKTQKVH